MARPLLENQYAIPFYPALAIALGGSSTGATKALLVQQIHYWCCHNKDNEKDAYHDGFWWTRKSISGWLEDFPCFGKNTIVRALDGLREAGIVVTASFSSKQGDTTLWYRIDYRVLRRVLKECPETADSNLDDYGLTPRPRPPFHTGEDGYLYSADGHRILL